MLIGAFILFAGNGLNASSITRTANQSSFVRAGLLGVWLVSTLPAIRPLLRDPQVQFLKTQPVPEAEVLGIVALFVLIAESPWIALWVRGAPVIAAASASLSAVALHTLWLARPWRSGLALLFCASLGAWLWAPPFAALPLALIAAGVGVVAAWRRGLEEVGGATVWPLRGPPWMALGLAYVATLVRAHGSIWLRCSLLAAIGARLVYFAVENRRMEQFTDIAELTTALFAIVVLILLAALAGPLLRAERSADWVLASAGISRGERQWSRAFALAIPAALSVPLFGGIVAIGLRLPTTQTANLLLSLVLASLSLAVVLERVACGALRDTGGDSRRLLVGVSGLAVLFLIGLHGTGRWLAVALSLLGAFAALVRARSGRKIVGSHGAAPGVEEHVLTVENLSKRLGARQVLKAVNLTISRGETALVHGVNGAGKSTLLRIVAGLLRPDGGTLSLCGAGLARESVRYKASLGFVPDTLEVFPELLVGEYVKLIQSLKRGSVLSVELPAGLSERLGIDGVWQQSLSSLSFGQRKRLATFVALIGDPFLLVLDEPSNGLDPAGVDSMVALIAERARREQATLCSTNDAAFAARLGASDYRLNGGCLQTKGEALT